MPWKQRALAWQDLSMFIAMMQKVDGFDSELFLLIRQLSKAPFLVQSTGVGDCRHVVDPVSIIRRGLMLTIGLLALGLIGGGSVASAGNLFTIDSHSASPGNVIEDPGGSAYIAWVHSGEAGGPDAPRFCKVTPGGGCTTPISLPIPLIGSETSLSALDSVSGAFPLFGTGSTVYVVAPRYVQDDVILYTSTDGGQSFTAVVSPGSTTAGAGPYSNKVDPTDVLRSGSSFLIGANDPGLGFSMFGAATGNFSFSSTGEGEVAGSSLGFDGSGNPVEAYWNLSSPYRVLFYRYSGLGSLVSQANWTGPITIGAGYESKLAGGSSGLFLVSQDYQSPGSTKPGQLDLRKYNGTTFGAPLTLINDANVELFDGGAIAQSPGGHLAVAWPGIRAGDQSKVMRLFSSSDGGATFSETDVAHLGGGYGVGNNAQLALGDSGGGWLTFRDSAGLQVADLSPIAPAPASPSPAPASAPGPASTPPTYSGANKTSTATVGGGLLVLAVPKTCLTRGQPFYVAVSSKRLGKGGRLTTAKLKIVRVTFLLDGKKLEALKKKPFRFLVDPGLPIATGKHTVGARVTAIVKKNGRKKRVTRTLSDQITLC
jgi:hypothetical protein